MNPVIEKGLKINPNMILNPNGEHVEKILLGLEKKRRPLPMRNNTKRRHSMPMQKNERRKQMLLQTVPKQRRKIEKCILRRTLSDFFGVLENQYEDLLM